MAFEIRRNRPYVGAVTLTKVGIGSFNAKEIVVSKPEFLAKFSRYFEANSVRWRLSASAVLLHPKRRNP